MCRFGVSMVALKRAALVFERVANVHPQPTKHFPKPAVGGSSCQFRQDPHHFINGHNISLNIPLFIPSTLAGRSTMIEL